ncbi:hypothetical protein, partial [Xanthomonas campestris]|uniref:hypothetical protein n=1 Tax=Xanthomonas campestris TaxID=339 RepID=UPI003D6EF4FF
MTLSIRGEVAQGNQAAKRYACMRIKHFAPRVFAAPALFRTPSARIKALMRLLAFMTYGLQIDVACATQDQTHPPCVLSVLFESSASPP